MWASVLFLMHPELGWPYGMLSLYSLILLYLKICSFSSFIRVLIGISHWKRTEYDGFLLSFIIYFSMLKHCWFLIKIAQYTFLLTVIVNGSSNQFYKLNFLAWLFPMQNLPFIFEYIPLLPCILVGIVSAGFKEKDFNLSLVQGWLCEHHKGGCHRLIWSENILANDAIWSFRKGYFHSSWRWHTIFWTPGWCPWFLFVIPCFSSYLLLLPTSHMIFRVFLMQNQWWRGTSASLDCAISYH